MTLEDDYKQKHTGFVSTQQRPRRLIFHNRIYLQSKTTVPPYHNVIYKVFFRAKGCNEEDIKIAKIKQEKSINQSIYHT